MPRWNDPEIDKRSWGAGPWEGEPDIERWVDIDTGLQCLAWRNEVSGTWCGYVGVPRKHALHGVHYELLEDVEVHGGLTFSGPRVLSVGAREGDDQIHWFGFDCAHAFDMMPAIDAMLRQKMPDLRRENRIVYRRLGFVQAECTDLAAQIDRYTRLHVYWALLKVVVRHYKYKAARIWKEWRAKK